MNLRTHWLRYLFFISIVRPIVWIVIGLNIRNRHRIPKKGPAILVANHNSHLDSMVLMSLFPLSMLKKLRPVAAADYFLRSGPMAWFSQNIIGIIPIRRSKSQEKNPEKKEDLLAPISESLDREELVIFFPEGTRGEPEVMAKFKFGIAKLAERHPNVPIHPFFFHGLGKALPRGEGLLVPFVCQIFVGEPLRWNGSHEKFLESLEKCFEDLRDESEPPSFEELRDSFHEARLREKSAPKKAVNE